LVILVPAVVAIYPWRELVATKEAHLADVKASAAQTLDIALKKIDSDNKRANALEGLEEIVDAALNTMKRCSLRRTSAPEPCLVLAPDIDRLSRAAEKPHRYLS
jgi:hypothetical protein